MLWFTYIKNKLTIGTPNFIKELKNLSFCYLFILLSNCSRVRGYKANDWYQLAEYINTINKKKTTDEISDDIDNIIPGIFTPAENKSVDNKLFIPKAMRNKLGL